MSTSNDEQYYRGLQDSLNLLERERVIQWLETSAGSPVEDTMQAYLHQADLILLLISPDFFVKDHCYRAMNLALREHVERQVPVVPILAKVSGWKMSACASLYALPTNEQPIAEWPRREPAYEDISSGLMRLLAGDRSFLQRQARETAKFRAHTTSTRESEDEREHGTGVQPGSLSIINNASNKGQQGIFNAKINNRYMK